MRKLLNTLFVTSEDAYLTLETENVAVYIREEKKAQYPLLVLESIISFSYKGASPALMGACARQGIQLPFLPPPGPFGHSPYFFLYLFAGGTRSPVNRA